MTLIHIGDVGVHRGRPENDNPYRNGGGLMGPERAEALRRYKHGEDTSIYTFWCARTSGGAYELKGPNEVNWETSGIK